MEKEMFLCSIMQLDLDHLDEICNDIREQVEQGIINCVLFKFTLVPEGTPPADKVGNMVRQYVVFRDRLRSMGVRNGVLVQESIGHGYALNAPSPFSKYINLNDGQESTTCCPMSDEFCEYFKGVMKTIAKAEPDLIMVDDDFRLIFRAGNGCACSMHMARFNELAGTNLSREELYEHLRRENNGRLAQIYVQTQDEALLKGARLMRQGIDEVDPKLQGAYCTSGNNAQCAVEIAEIMAGEGNPVILRVSNGTYVPLGTRLFTRDFYRAALHVAIFGKTPKWILAESDTIPYDRYGVSAQWFHSHYVGSLLEGCNGAKHWITNLNAYEPASSTAYHRVLAKHSGFYQTLAKLVPTLRWKGCRIPLNTNKIYFYSENGWESNSDHVECFGTYVLEKMGLPMYFSTEQGGVTFLAGEGDTRYSDEELKKLLSGKVVMTAEIAKRLESRGLSEWTGVSVREWTGAQPTKEFYSKNGQNLRIQKSCMEMLPLNDSVRVLSTVCNSSDATNYTPLFPGCVEYRNAFGGTVVVFAGTPIAEFNYVEGFGFLSQSRKEQIIDILTEMNELPIYYADDGEVYLKSAEMEDGRRFCSIFNLSYDVLENARLWIDRDVSDIEILCPDGTTRPCAFRKDGRYLILEEILLPLEPMILFIK